MSIKLIGDVVAIALCVGAVFLLAQDRVVLAQCLLLMAIAVKLGLLQVG